MQRVILNIDGMSCVVCQNKVQQAIEQVPGVQLAQVNLIQNKASVLFDETVCSLARIKGAVEEAGYEASDDHEASPHGLSLKKHQNALIVTAVLTAILMFMGMGPMLGLHYGMTARSSGALQAVLCVAIILLQFHFFKSGIISLVRLSPNMDSLVAVGAGASFLYSLWNFLHISPEASTENLHEYGMYFESAAAILCFVGVGKFFELKLKHSTASAITRLMQLSPEKANVRRAGKVMQVPAREIIVGDTIVLKAGDTLCCDGVVVEGRGHFNQSSITGEPYPVTKSPGDSVISATMLMDGYVEVSATQVGDDTTFNKIVHLIDDAVSKKAPIARLADRISQYFVPAVIALSVITFLAHKFLGAETEQALMFAVSVLVVSCPCALGLATPAALVAGLGLASRKGVLFKDAGAIQMLSYADTVCFDKTGTLTEGRMEVIKQVGCERSEEKICQLFALSLERRSSHPIAAAFERAYAHLYSSVLDVRDFSITAGKGISGFVDDHVYGMLNRPGIEELSIVIDEDCKNKLHKYVEQGLIVTSLVCDNRYMCSFVIGDEIKKSTLDAIKMIKQMDLEVYMLTGDHRRSADYISKRKELIDPANCFTELMPQDKAVIVQRLKREGKTVCMVGDGINDAPAFSVADVAISLSGASDIALDSCQVVLLKRHMFGVAEAVRLARRIMLNIRQNLFWAFFYNIITIPVACGIFAGTLNISLNPVIAALLMSVSSICVVGNAARLGFGAPDDGDEMQFTREAEHGGHNMKNIYIEGMSCSHCTSSVQKALSALPGCSDVEVSLDDKRATLSCADTVSDRDLKETIENLGYQVSRIEAAAQ